MIYFDSAATTLQKPESVYAAVQRTMRACASVGRGGHAAADAAARVVYACRTEAAELFDAAPEQVVFTMNATHGLNIALRSLVRPGGRVVLSGMEHNAVTRPLAALGAQIETADAPPFAPERLLEGFACALRQGADAAVCTHVSNVYGNVLPVSAVAALCRERGVPLVIDASQSAGTLPVSLRGTGAAFIAMPGHKGLYGPQGTGLLLCGAAGEPLLLGGTGSNSLDQSMPDFLPDRHEAGTHNVCGIGGLLAGLRFVRERRPEELLAEERALTALAARPSAAAGRGGVHGAGAERRSVVPLPGPRLRGGRRLSGGGRDRRAGRAALCADGPPQRRNARDRNGPGELLCF